MKVNNIRFLFRSFKRNRNSFFINLLGLSTGLACVIIIYLWVSDELNVDKFHKNDKYLYQVMENHQIPEGTTTQAWTPDLLASTLAQERTDIKLAVAVMGVEQFDKFTLTASNEKVIKASGQFAEASFFEVFSYRLEQGDPTMVLADKNSIVVSKEIAQSLFSSVDNVIGKTIDWQILGQKGQATISGIFDGIPSNSTSDFDFVLSFDTWLNLSRSIGREIHWGNHAPFTYLVLNEGTDIKKFNSEIADFLKSRSGQSNISLFAAPYSSRYLHGVYIDGKQAGGRIGYVKLFIVIAFFILLIACINFINMATAKAARRVKEVGVRKVSGCSRKALIAQFVFETFVIVFIAILFALLLVILILPQFNLITDKHLGLPFTAQFFLQLLSICIVTGILTSLYPAMYLSGFSPATVLKGKQTKSASELWVRKGLVVFQFGMSIVLITSMIVIYKQIQYIQNKNLGYNKEHVIYFGKEGNIAAKQDAFLADIRSISGVTKASDMNGELTGVSISTYDIYWPGKTEESEIRFEMMHVDHDLIEALGIEMAEGRSYSSQFGNEENKLILNQRAAEMMELKNPIGQSVRMWGKDLQIIGIVKDFHFQSLRDKVNPLIITFMPNKTVNMVAKLTPGTEKQTLAEIERIYKKFNPGMGFEYQFLDTAFHKLYVAEERVSVLSRYFALLGILISCLGLFGLAAYASEQRTKEIGIRKVNGAKISEVLIMLNKNFVKWVAIAFVIATPVAYYAMNKWLQNFAYKTELSWWIFALSGLLALSIALLTVSWQSWRAATRNPVEALRYE